jgi:hypothetical protein
MEAVMWALPQKATQTPAQTSVITLWVQIAYDNTQS